MGVLDDGYDQGPIRASQVRVDTSNFTGNLSAADTDVQKALETLDQMSGGGGGGFWTQSGGYLYPTTIADIVLLGTTTPFAGVGGPLQVKGTSQIAAFFGTSPNPIEILFGTDYSAKNAMVLGFLSNGISDSTNYGYVQLVGVDPGRSLKFQTDGNVGVNLGTSTALFPLHVTGTSPSGWQPQLLITGSDNIQANLALNGNADRSDASLLISATSGGGPGLAQGYLQMYNDHDDTYSPFNFLASQLIFSVTPTNYAGKIDAITIPDTGFVGLGVVPTQKLHVYGGGLFVENFDGAMVPGFNIQSNLGPITGQFNYSGNEADNGRSYAGLFFGDTKYTGTRIGSLLALASDFPTTGILTPKTFLFQSNAEGGMLFDNEPDNDTTVVGPFRWAFNNSLVAMQLTSDGLLQIGDPITDGNPARKLTIGNATGITSWMVGQDTTHNLVMDWDYNVTPSLAAATIGTYGNNNPLNITALIIALNPGNGFPVGVGTATPGLAFEIASDAADNTAILRNTNILGAPTFVMYTDDVTAVTAVFGAAGSGGISPYAGNVFLAAGSAGTGDGDILLITDSDQERVRVQHSTGFVGIGVIPIAQLHTYSLISGTVADPAVIFENAATAYCQVKSNGVLGAAAFSLLNTDSNQNWLFGLGAYSGSSDFEIADYTNTAIRMIIKETTGYIGLGVSPVYPVDIYNTSPVVIGGVEVLNLDSNAHTSLRINAPDGYNPNVRFYVDDVGIGEIGVDASGNFMYIGGYTNSPTGIYIDLSTGAILANHKVTVTGDVQIGDADAYYLGDSGTDGSWRFIRDGDDLVRARRESGVWVEKARDLA